jgi:hypothetical protein
MGHMRLTVAIAMFALIVAACGSRNATVTRAPQPTPSPTPVDPIGTLVGQVTVGPLCPVEPCLTPGANPYEGRHLVLTHFDPNRSPVHIPLSVNGEFAVELHYWDYRVTLNECPWLGCKAALPVKTSVDAGETTTLQIDIDTGIR